MKYLIRNKATNVIELLFETPIIPTDDIEVIEVTDAQFKGDMLGSIFQSVNIYEPYPTEGTYWESNGTTWVDSRTDTEVWDSVRTDRDKELLECDWTQLDDSGLTPPQKGLWTAYRNQLRNIPNNNPNDPQGAEQALKNAKRDDKPGRGRSD